MTITPTRPSIVSKHALGRHGRCKIEAENISAWCRIPGSPYFDGLFLMPNHPSAGKVLLKFGPFDLEEHINAFSCSVASPNRRGHQNIINVGFGILDAEGNHFKQSRVSVACGELKSVTVPFDFDESRKVFLTFGTWFNRFVDPSAYGGVEIRNVIGFGRDVLTELFNQSGSDKGTAHSAGAGAPHCYSVEYNRILDVLREQSINFLEIGLDNESKGTGCPKDAPSLRVWRQFFPKARIYGYDINDFSFFSQAETFTFQGDQSSRDDIRRFLREFSSPRFDLVLDDGSHASSHQQISLATLFPTLIPGGMYLIEDLGWQPFPESPTTLQLLHRFNETGRLDSPFIDDTEARYLEAEIAKVEIYRPNDSEFAVVYKKHS